MITIIKAEPHHAEEMHEIEAEAFAAAWSEVSIRHEITREHSYCFVAVDETGKLHGHAYMWHIINEGQIINIAVRKLLRNNGTGSLLLQKLIETASEKEMLGLTLEVRASNNAAISLYEKHGFTAHGTRKNYYSQPTEDGIIMWKYL